MVRFSKDSIDTLWLDEDINATFPSVSKNVEDAFLQGLHQALTGYVVDGDVAVEEGRRLVAEYRQGTRKQANGTSISNRS